MKKADSRVRIPNSIKIMTNKQEAGVASSNFVFA
jgi:hypothetical protein